jgi:quinoprotein glucose dehydrogenase
VYDKATGTRLHSIELDAFSAAAPMTYMHRGKQYIVVATGMGPNSELIALTLPAKAESGK